MITGIIRKIGMVLISFSFALYCQGQLKWINVDSLYQPLPSSVHVFRSTDTIDGKPNIAYYVSADLKDKKLFFDADTTVNRRLTPNQFFQKNNQPLVVVNTTFFSFQTNQNLNVVIMDGKLVGYNLKSIYSKKDSIYHYITRSALGITNSGDADIAWLYTDTSKRWPYALTYGPTFRTGRRPNPRLKDVKWAMPCSFGRLKYKWKMQTAVGGGPVLLQYGEINVTNEREMMFVGKAINDKHPRTAMGYTKDNKLIILVVQGRFPGIAEGATLPQEARILQELGCWEALNLDGGGSSCMLVNGKETIKPSDATGQRAVPAVFIIRKK